MPEKRYVDANILPDLFDEEYKKTRKLIKEGETHLDNLAEGFTEAYDVINRAPTEDVTPVIRCKDCKFYDLTELFNCQYTQYVFAQPYDFCSYAERKDEK